MSVQSKDSVLTVAACGPWMHRVRANEGGVSRHHRGGCVLGMDSTRILVLQWCYSGVTVVLQWCYTGVTVVLQWCYSGVTVVLQ
jgi:hypothetical protein